MSLFGGLLTVKTVSFLMLSVLAIAALGYLLGRVRFKGISLGTAGVFVVALLYGCFFYNTLSEQFVSGGASYVSNALKIIENMGLILFVSAVGFIAGPKFFSNFVRNFKSYILLGVIIILSGGIACAICLLVQGNFTDLTSEELAAMMVGLLAGALTSTPAFSASKEAVGAELEGIVSVGYGIAYLFGVIGVVLFVQLVPRLAKADMRIEREAITEKGAASGTKKTFTGALVNVDSFGLMPFALAAVLGIMLGSIKIGSFSLTTTGGCLLVSLIFGHFSRIPIRPLRRRFKGRRDKKREARYAINLMPDEKTLKVFREFGLMLFLIGAGVAGGANFVKYFQPIYFLYGIVMTMLPLMLGFLFAKYVLKMKLLNNLGSITGGMTSTPALGTLIQVSGTEDVAAAYAATYPISLIAVVLVSQFIIIIF